MKPEVTAAIARLTADRYELNGLGICEREDDIKAVYKSFLDARPITAEGLKERGFEESFRFTFHATVGGAYVHAYHNNRPGAGDGEWYWSVNTVSLPHCMDPQTQGDLTTLLLRLERGDG